ncbi:hypothetical protein R1flu_021427 [Riccia fluitans]|uniref:Uncharacterized protein n=1 Tax=Riccia fluitans TaxID=41844 RepID=A0ABD1ZSM3_9MARC
MIGNARHAEIVEERNGERRKKVVTSYQSGKGQRQEPLLRLHFSFAFDSGSGRRIRGPESSSGAEIERVEIAVGRVLSPLSGFWFGCAPIAAESGVNHGVF